MNDEEAQKKLFMNQQLRQQVEGERTDTEQRRRNERAQDTVFLNKAIDVQQDEDEIKRQKEEVTR